MLALQPLDPALLGSVFCGLFLPARKRLGLASRQLGRGLSLVYETGRLVRSYLFPVFEQGLETRQRRIDFR
jgi:hypothetical protein